MIFLLSDIILNVMNIIIYMSSILIWVKEILTSKITLIKIIILMALKLCIGTM